MATKKTQLLITLLASVSLLTACQNQEKTAQPSKPKSSQTDKKADTDKSVAKPNQADTKTNTSPSVQENNPQATEKTNAQTETSTATPENQTSVFPQALLGTWVGQSQQADDISITFEPNGQVTTSAHFEAWEEPTVSVAYVSQADDLGNNYYRVLDFEGDYQALMPGITGMGGWGQMYEVHGFKIVNNQLSIVSWRSGDGVDFNWSEPVEFQFTLQKQ